jgi:hypothetical protein
MATWDITHEELRDLYNSCDIVGIVKCRGYMWRGKIIANRVLMEKPPGK